MRISTLLLTVLALLATACSSVKSVETPAGKKADGLIYFMPKKDIVVSMDAKDGVIGSITIDTTDAYPDIDKQYVMRHGGNVFGKNTLDVAVNSKGLLTSANSKTVSGVTEALKNLSASAARARQGVLDTGGGDGREIEHECDEERTYSFVFEAEHMASPETKCGLKIRISQRGEASGGVAHGKTTNKAYSGIFYRQNRPYLVSIADEDSNKIAEKIVFSPSEAPINFVPVSKTFFASNEADFEFVDGVPTKYKQDADGEIVALFKLPADVLEAYFSAVGATLDAFKSADQKESDALTQSLALELAKRKYDACIKAIEANDTELIKELEC